MAVGGTAVASWVIPGTGVFVGVAVDVSVGGTGVTSTTPGVRVGTGTAVGVGVGSFSHPAIRKVSTRLMSSTARIRLAVSCGIRYLLQVLTRTQYNTAAAVRQGSAFYHVKCH
jgi:hypothetical protein